MRDISVEGSVLLGALIGGCLFGFYSCLFMVTLYSLSLIRRRNIVVMLSLVLLYLLVGAHIVVYCTYTTNAFLARAGETHNYLMLFHRPILGIDFMLYFIANLIAESLLLWRTWIVWTGTSRKYMLLPGFFYIAYIAVSIASLSLNMWQFVRNEDRTDSRNGFMVASLIIIMLLQSVTMTVMIAGRLWYVGQLVACEGSSSPYGPLCHAVLESATLYTLAMVATLITVRAPHLFQVMLNVLGVLVGIAPTLIVFSINVRLPSGSNPNTSVTGTIVSPSDGTVSTKFEFRAAKPSLQSGLSCSHPPLSPISPSTLQEISPPSSPVSRMP